MGPLQREVRTVAQVTYDETRVRDRRAQGRRMGGAAAGERDRPARPPGRTAARALLPDAGERRAGAARSPAGSPPTSPGAPVRHRPARATCSNRRGAGSGTGTFRTSEVARLERTGVAGRTVAFAAPVSGVVVEKLVLAGQRVMAGEPLYKIADLGARLAGRRGLRARPPGGTHRARRARPSSRPAGNESHRPHHLRLSDAQSRRHAPAAIRVELPNADHRAQARHVRDHPLQGAHRDGAERAPLRRARHR